jgi:peptidoglycan/xylan/chitin deacetylase (PgdA/CDA1 family)
MYLVKTPKFIQTLFPNFHWSIPTSTKNIYLTFDDGPIPDVTPWILDQLRQFQAKATFFCVGDNVRKHPKVFQQVIDYGHQVGNHTFNHFNGWGTESIKYFHNVRKCARIVQSDLFRPPYGRLTPRQVQFLQRHYKIIMWDVLSGDFDQDLSKEQCLKNVLTKTQNGSIVVFHDSIKAMDKVKYVLPKVLKFFQEKGYRFEALTPDTLDRKLDYGKSAYSN